MKDKNKQSFLAHAKELLGVDGWGKLKQKFEEATEETTEETTEQTMMEATLVDGTKVTYEALAEGQKLTIVTEEGEIDAPDGTHELANGTKITTSGGLMTAIEEPAVEEVVEEAMTSEKVQSMIDAAIPKKDEEMAQAFAAIQKENKALKEDMGKIVGMMDFFMEESATAEPQPQKFGKEKAIDKRKKIAELMAQYSIKS